MITNSEKVMNAINTSSSRLRTQSMQRRTSVTDIHGMEYTASTGEGVPAQFYTAISFDVDRIAKWGFKIIVNPYELKAISEGDTATGEGFGGDGSYNGGPLNYGGRQLAASVVARLVSEANKKALLPSGLISQLWSESNWGNSYSGRNDNNWSGMTGSAGTRPSGVTVSTGSARPAAEGGTYMRYASVEDFITDWTYLLANQTSGNKKMYNVQGKTNFNEFVKGLFRAGGALYDYAAAGYNHYLGLMASVRKGINDANGGILDKLDAAVTTPRQGSAGSQSTTTVIRKSQAELEAEAKQKAEAELAKQNDAPKTKAALGGAASLLGRTVGNGECYGLVAWYSKQLGGPGLGGGVTGLSHVIGDTMAAANIGTGYNWGATGWGVKLNPGIQDIKVGSIINIKANMGAPVYTGVYGHTAIVEKIQGDQLTILEQNYAGKRFVTRNVYNLIHYTGVTASVCYPPEIASGKSIGAGSTPTVTKSKVFTFDKNIKILLDGVDITAMLKAQYGGKWIDKYAMFPSEEITKYYDIMKCASAMKEDERKKIFAPGEHLLEVSSTMQADIKIRMYLKYSHIN